MKLDKEQDKIVHSDKNNILVIASAGSGKTRVLTERIRHLVCDKHISPKNIITITFTNQAASELVTRLSNVPGIENAFIGTIHSFAYHTLKYNNRAFQILNDELDIQLHLELIKKYCKFLTSERYLKFRQLEVKYQLRLIDSEQLMRYLTRDELDELHQIEIGVPNETYKESIVTLCKDRNIITFTELLKLAIKDLNDAGAHSEYVFVDEFQDIGRLEYKFIMSLNAKHYFFVGDDWQSIYSFKGGNVGIFKSLYKDRKYTNYYLINNYRSTKEVIEFSNKIINKVTDKFNKNVRCINDKPGFVITTNLRYLDRCLNYIKKKFMYKEWFILTRTNSEAYELGERLSKLDIPFSIFKRDGATNADISRYLSYDTVKIMTIHASKGLECDNVLVYGKFSLDSKFYCRPDDPDYEYKLFKYEEELKVFYVGASRARNNLIVIDTTPKNQNNLSKNLQILDK